MGRKVVFVILFDLEVRIVARTHRLALKRRLGHEAVDGSLQGRKVYPGILVVVPAVAALHVIHETGKLKLFFLGEPVFHRDKLGAP